MAERVSTGGVKSFDYGKRERKLDEERKKGIEEGYEKYYERKRREKRRKVIGIIVLILILLALAAIFIYF